MLLRGASSPGEFLEKLEGGGNDTKDGKFDSFSTAIKKLSWELQKRLERLTFLR